MKLEEIKAILDENYTERPGENHADHAQRIWDNAPRMPYKELPLSLQKDVRERFTTDIMRRFLHDCYQPFSAFVKKINPELGAKVEAEEHYISFEDMTNGIPADVLDKLLIRTRNRAVYTIGTDGKQTTMDGQEEYILAPTMYGDAATEAFETVLAEYQKKQKQKEEKKNSPAPPRAANVLVSTGFYQSIISDEKYQLALSMQRNPNAFIALMKPEFFEKFMFENGEMTYDGEVAGIIKKYSQGKYEDLKELDLPLLWNIYTAALNARTRVDAYTITVDTVRFFKEANIDIKAGNAQEMEKKLNAFKDCVGFLPGLGTISTLISILDLDLKKGEMTLAVPYMFRLFTLLEEKNNIQKQTKQGRLYEYRQPAHNRLVHSSIASERNKAAVEIVYAITNNLLRRGYIPDSQLPQNRKKQYSEETKNNITYTVSYRGILNDCYMLRMRVKSYDKISNKNNALRRAFSKAYELLGKKTDIFQHFCNLKINNKVIPTMQMLDYDIEFVHTGRNGDYKPRK